MKSQSHRFTNDKLLEILSLSQNATAIYTGEEITIQTANDEMIGFWGKDRTVIGKPLAEAVPELLGQPFLGLIREVWTTGITHSSKDASVQLNVDGAMKTYYFDYVYRAITNENGEVDCILHTATDVTELNLNRNLIAQAKEQQEALDRELILNKALAATNDMLGTTNEELAAALEELNATNEELQQTQDNLNQINEELESRVLERTRRVADLNEELEAANEELLSSIEELAASEYQTRNIIENSPFPIGVYTGAEMRIVFANKAITDVWGKGPEVIGKRYSEVLPELESQEVYAQLHHVYTTGLTFEARNQQIDLVVNGSLTVFYFNYIFTALKNEAGEIYGVMNTAADVTDVVLSKQRVQSSADEFATLNEELAAMNEEMVAVNEELAAMNEEMVAVNEELANVNDELAGSERKFRSLIKQAPVAMNVFKTRDLIVEDSNEMMLEIWGKTEAIHGLKFSEAVPGIAGHPYENLLLEVFDSGKPYYGLEHKAVLLKDNALQERYFNFIYQPIIEENGSINSVLHVATEVTEQVNARKEVADINTRLNIAIDAGALGSTEVDIATGNMECNEHWKRCFGRTKDEPFTYPDLFAAMLPKYRDNVREMVKYAQLNNTIYQAEYEVMWPDGSIHWINAHGKARYNSEGKAVKMVGIISDVTEFKQDEQRKNDFIAMVSHELKTPLTSLTGYVQMLQRKALKNEDNFTAGALESANKQVRKMTTMINGFLNVSRLESGKIHIERQSFDMALLIKEVEQEFKDTVSSHQIAFSEIEETYLHADRDKIGQVINNFISNAIKYSPSSQTISVTSRVVNQEVIVAVRDEGKGIKLEDQQRLFERYYRVKDQPSNISGFGIGLYLCAEVINRHNGRIWVESEADKGSTFYFSLPL